MKCYLCGEGMRVKGANRKKIDGVWMHKACPAEVARRKIRKMKKLNAKEG
jgi:hypothetical protein